MSKLNYTHWVSNDVMPDALFSYQQVDVQGFLQKKNSFLKDYKINDVFYADWLDTQCKAAGLNPKVILVNLQKEQSLVSKITLPPEKIMNRALGYGMTDDGDQEQYYGFDKQNIAAISRMPMWFEKLAGQTPQPPILVDGGKLSLFPLSAFTSVLYRYTPWTGSPDSTYYPKWGVHGNYLFWLIWKGWWKSDLKQYMHLTAEEINQG